MHRTTLALACGLGVGGALACVPTKIILDDDHCNTHDGDAFCARMHPDGSAPYCWYTNPQCDAANGANDPDVDGCFAQKPEDSCWSACGGDRPLSENPDCEPMTSGGTGSSTGDTGESSTSTGGSTGDSGSESTTGGVVECEGHEACTDAAAPYCQAGECVSCEATSDGDAACAELDVAVPLCVAGACVQCAAGNDAACGGETPVCDEGSNACVGCSEHAQCETACEVATGACLGGNIYVVDGDGGADATTIGDALTALQNDGGVGTIVVHERNGGLAYQENLALQADNVVAIIGASGESPSVLGTGAPTLTVPAGATLYLEGLEVTGNNVGVAVEGGTAYVSRSRIVNNTSGGIVVDGNGELTLVNAMVGGDESDVAAVRVEDGAARITYSTLAGGYGTATALTCGGGATPVVVRNSILVARTDTAEIACGQAQISYSLAEMAVGDASDGNAELEGDPTALFNTGGQNNFVAGNFILISTDSPAADVARWQTGDPATDFNGTPRPTTPGAMDYAGADVPG